MEKFASKFGIAVITIVAIMIVAHEWPSDKSKIEKGSGHVPAQVSPSSPVLPYGEHVLVQFEQKGIWRVDRENHRCMMDVSVWRLMPIEYKEKTLQVIYVEEGTWWSIIDDHSGKELGKVSSWGPKVFP